MPNIMEGVCNIQCLSNPTGYIATPFSDADPALGLVNSSSFHFPPGYFFYSTLLKTINFSSPVIILVILVLFVQRIAHRNAVN